MRKENEFKKMTWKNESSTIESRVEVMQAVTGVGQNAPTAPDQPYHRSQKMISVMKYWFHFKFKVLFQHQSYIPTSLSSLKK